MKRTMLAAAAVLAVACNHGAPQTPASNQAAGTSAQPDTTPGTHTQQPSNDAPGNSSVQLVGCLQGPVRPAAAGGAPASAATAAHGSNATARYVLAHVTVESGGIGANGAGGSAGPLLSPGGSVELDGVPADAQNSVNKQVRIVGRIDTRRAAVGDTSMASGSARNNGTSGSGTGASSEVPGTTAG